MQKEIWKDVVGYEGLYQVSDMGRIFSCRRNIYLSPGLISAGYLNVILQKNANRKNKLIHRLVYEAFVGHVKNIDHKDTDKQNNNLSNLRVCNSIQNSGNKRKSKNSISKFKGAYYQKRTKNWVSQIKINGKSTHIGYFKKEELAAKAYDKAALKYFGEYARTNEMMGLYE